MRFKRTKFLLRDGVFITFDPITRRACFFNFLPSSAPLDAEPILRGQQKVKSKTSLRALRLERSPAEAGQAGGERMPKQ